MIKIITLEEYSQADEFEKVPADMLNFCSSLQDENNGEVDYTSPASFLKQKKEEGFEGFTIFKSL